MNECLTTPQHEKQIDYWVSEKDKCMKWFYKVANPQKAVNTTGQLEKLARCVPWTAGVITVS